MLRNRSRRGHVASRRHRIVTSPPVDGKSAQSAANEPRTAKLPRCDGKCVTRAALVESTRAWQNLRLGAEVAKRQTQWTQNPPGAIPCGFKSRPRHHSNA